jgi:cytoskeletal protein RodZ
MKLRRLAALVSAVVLSIGMVSAVSATDSSTQPSEDPSKAPECQNEQGQPIACASEDASSEPSEDASVEPSEDASVEPSEDASVEPSEDTSEEPTVPGEVEGLTSDPTLPPTDALSGNGTSGPDGSLPLVLMILGTIGLAAVVLTPARAKR